MDAKNLKDIQKTIGIGIGVLLCIGFLIYFGPTIVINGVIIGILTIIGLAILWLKSPPWVKKWLAKGDLFTDLLFTVLAFFAFGLTITGIVTAAVTCIMMSLLLRINRIIYKDKSASSVRSKKDTETTKSV